VTLDVKHSDPICHGPMLSCELDRIVSMLYDATPDEDAEATMKEIEIIPLARRKMERRGIPESWVTETLRSAEQIVEGHGSRLVAQQRRRIRRKEKLLRVVFEETQDKYVVITTYLTSDIKRYWKEKAP
jgi:Domain of unknown function (DUF4258)